MNANMLTVVGDYQFEKWKSEPEKGSKIQFKLYLSQDPKKLMLTFDSKSSLKTRVTLPVANIKDLVFKHFELDTPSKYPTVSFTAAAEGC